MTNKDKGYILQPGRTNNLLEWPLPGQELCGVEGMTAVAGRLNVSQQGPAVV